MKLFKQVEGYGYVGNLSTGESDQDKTSMELLEQRLHGQQEEQQPVAPDMPPAPHENGPDQNRHKDHQEPDNGRKASKEIEQEGPKQDNSKGQYPRYSKEEFDSEIQMLSDMPAKPAITRTKFRNKHQYTDDISLASRKILYGLRGLIFQ